jgi:hypothetical protein
MRERSRIAGWLAAAALAFAVALLVLGASAVIIDGVDGTANTSAPPDDPGWDHVGTRGNLTAIYLGDGWVLTANHVGISDIVLGGVAHPPVLQSQSQVEHGDLQLFRLVTEPGLPPLPLTSSSPSFDSDLVMIGHGRDRGPATSWGGLSGYAWDTTFSMRWGTNRVSSRVPFDVVTDGAGGLTRTFAADFGSGLPTLHEAMGAVGDSGGAVFVDTGVSWELAGVIYAKDSEPGQPAETALYTNDTWIVDLSYYRPQILAISAERACSDGTDDDGDGLIDWPADPGCGSASDPFETNALVACDDGIDQDGDLLVDWPADPGCRDASWPFEDPQCDDGIDNDGDGSIDWAGGPLGEPADPQCVSPWRNRERRSSCGLGFELALLLPPLLALRGRRKRATA